MSHTTLSHTNFDTQLCHTPSFAPSFPHHLSHTTLSHTIFHTQLCRTPSLTHHFVTHNFVTHHLSHTTLSHTIFYTPSLTPNFAHTIFHTYFVAHHLSHTTLSHTISRHTSFHTPLCHTPSFTHNFVTRSLSHTTFTHTPSFTRNFAPHTIFLCHTPSFTYNFVSHNFVLFLDPPPTPLSFLPSPSPLQNLVLIIGRSCLVGLSGPLIGLGRCTGKFPFWNRPAAAQDSTSMPCSSLSIRMWHMRVLWSSRSSGFNTELTPVCVCPLVDGLHPSAGVCATKTLTAFR